MTLVEILADASAAQLPQTARLLIVDDNAAIHADFKKVLTVEDHSELEALGNDLFDEPGAKQSASTRIVFSFDSAHQGMEALELVKAAVKERRPYSVAFVDVRMPPGWDGIETIAHLWEVDPALQIVLCSAYSDYDWTGITEKLDAGDRLLILKKPFDNIEVLQLAHALSRKWALSRILTDRLHDLEARVVERTAALQERNEELQREATLRMQAESKLRLMEKLEAVGHLAAGLAHEINTPLCVVVANLSFIEESVTTLLELAQPRAGSADAQDIAYMKEECPRMLQDTKEAADRVTAVVRTARELARPATFSAARANLCTSLDATVAIARATHKEVASVELDCGEGVPDVVCHVLSVNQVVHELIDNAAYSIGEARRDSGAIRIALRNVGDEIVIAIKDNGAGIKQEHQSSVFNPFFTTREVGKGMGRGLSTAHLVIVDQHGGRIYFETVPGQGTTFFVHLPVHGPRIACGRPLTDALGEANVDGASRSC